jgi:phosphate transport system substrate-binding protein
MILSNLSKLLKPMKRIFTKLGIAAASLALIASTQAGNITVKGSDTLLLLAQKWAEVYMQKHEDVKISVNGGGSGVGFAALQNGSTDIADASRPIKSAEIMACLKTFGKPTEYKVALDGLSVYVHEENPITELSIEQLGKIFTGKVKNWKELGGPDKPITIYSRENSSGTYEFFKEHVLKGADFAPNAQTLQGTAQIISAVAKEPRGIGYGGAAYTKGVKALKVKKDADSPGVEPNEENVLNQTYPIWRFLYNYVDPQKDKGEIGAYLKWIRSDEGQKIVKDVGYYPLPDKWREK